MNATKRPLESFEDRLLTELRQIVSDRAEGSLAAPAPATPQRSRRPVSQRRIAFGLAAAAALVAGLLIGVPLVGGEKASSPAYAIERTDDGTITVTIYRWEDPEGLEHDLEANGIPAEVDVLPYGQVCKTPRFKPAGWPNDKILMSSSSRTPGVEHITLRPGDFRPGWTLVLTSHLPTTEGGVGVFYGPAASVADGPVAACEPVDMRTPRPTR